MKLNDTNMPSLAAIDLRVDGESAPRGVITTPELCWKLEARGAVDQEQAVAEIEVDAILVGGEVIAAWRPGTVEHPFGTPVVYAGEALRSRCDYRWRVRLGNSQGIMGQWSDWAVFETGVIAPDAIEAQWVGGGGSLWRNFELPAKPVRARAYVTGLGYFKFFCNGKQVSQAALAPSLTYFEHHTEYDIIPLTDCLRPGQNRVGFLLGDSHWRLDGKKREARPLQAICEIVVDYADGRREFLRTDAAWQRGPEPLDAREMSPWAGQLFDGVDIDLKRFRQAVEGTDGPLAELGSVAVLPAPTAALTPALIPPIRKSCEMSPVHIEEMKAPTTYWFGTDPYVKPVYVLEKSGQGLRIDFGQNFSGWVRFRVRSPQGRRFVVRHAELLRADGSLNPDTLRAAISIDRYVTAGSSDGECLEPHFVYHGFRYAEIEGPIEEIVADSIRGIVAHTDLRQTGRIETDDAEVNWLLSSLQWTIRSNMFSVPTDVCQRDERQGWMMDGGTALASGTLFYDMSGLAKKWLQDIIAEQQADGSLPCDMVPAWHRSIPLRSIGWHKNFVRTALLLYDVYGETRVLTEVVPNLRRYAEHLITQVREDLIPAEYSFHNPEWLGIGYGPISLFDNALAVNVFRQVARAIRITGGAESERYDTIADRMAEAIHQKWFQHPSAWYGTWGDLAQANLAYVLWAGIVPQNQQQRVFERLVDDIMHVRGPGPFVTTGIGSTGHLPMVLSDYGRDDIVWDWLHRKEYPGYGFMRAHGATTLWERWENMTYHHMNASNHAGLTGIGEWLKERLVGLREQPGRPPQFELRPGVHLPLRALSASLDTRWGTVHVEWSTSGGQRALRVVVPAGCRGTLVLAGEQRKLELAAGEHQVKISVVQ